MTAIKRYILKVENEHESDLLPLHSTEQLGTVFTDRNAALAQLEALYDDLHRYACAFDHFNREEGSFSVSCIGISVVGRIEEITVTLTAIEFLECGLQFDYACKEEDCRAAIYAVAGYDPDEDEETPENLSATHSFLDKYGLPICDFAEGLGEEMANMRAKVIERYDSIFDANLDPNFLWNEAVKQILEQIRMAKTIPTTTKAQ